VPERNPQEKAAKIAPAEECTKSACSSESPPKIRASVAQLSRTDIPVERAPVIWQGHVTPLVSPASLLQSFFGTA
jgi:hypothetical protein